MVPSKMKILERKGTSIIATREEEQLLISEQSEVNLVSDEMTWVVDFVLLVSVFSFLSNL